MPRLMHDDNQHTQRTHEHYIPSIPESESIFSGYFQFCEFMKHRKNEESASI